MVVILKEWRPVTVELRWLASLKQETFMLMILDAAQGIILAMDVLLVRITASQTQAEEAA